MIIADFKDIHRDSVCFIVGKGPTLDRLTHKNVWLMRSAGPVFCCNEAIHKIEQEDQNIIGFMREDLRHPLYAVQQDSELEYRCVPKDHIEDHIVHFMHFFQHITPAICDISGAKLPVSKERCKISPWNRNAVLYGDGVDGTPRVRENELTAVAALKLAHYMGIRSVSFVAFDSWGGELGQYARCIGTDSGAIGEIGRHAVNGHEIREQARALMDHILVWRIDGESAILK